jgi:glucose/arabinose dehydrogenase
MKLPVTLARVLAVGATVSLALADHPGYQVKPVPFTKGVDQEVGGIDVLPDGRLVVCFHHGEIRLFQPKDETWTVFAHGLHEPLGIVAESPSSFVVMQRPELTRVSDTDGDGKADFYETLCDDFGMTGNYHEFAFGPVRTPDGHYLVSLNVASNGAPVREEIRGEWLELGLSREDFKKPWGSVKREAGRMYSRAPYRGWVVKVDPQSGEMTPWASGFRSPNGLGYDAEGRLFVTDNQGDWRGTSPLYHVEKGKFYGHPASLPWEKGYQGPAPLDIPIAELEKRRTPTAVWFPQGSMANSPTQPLLIPEGFGPFAGQLLVGEMNRARIVRVMLEKVNGVVQGACTPFLDDSGLARGVNRLAFGPDQTLWTGHTHLSWAGGEGMSRITWNPKGRFQDVQDISLQPQGFELEFLQPVSPEELKQVTLRRYTFAYHAAYGSPEKEKADVAFEIEPRNNSQTRYFVKCAENLRQDFCYEFQLPMCQNPLLCYTIREIP